MAQILNLWILACACFCPLAVASPRLPIKRGAVTPYYTSCSVINQTTATYTLPLSYNIYPVYATLTSIETYSASYLSKSTATLTQILPTTYYSTSTSTETIYTTFGTSTNIYVYLSPSLSITTIPSSYTTNIITTVTSTLPTTYYSTHLSTSTSLTTSTVSSTTYYSTATSTLAECVFS